MCKLIRNLLLGLVVALPPLFAVGTLTATAPKAEANGRYYYRSYRPYYRDYYYRPYYRGYYNRPYYNRYYGTGRYYYYNGPYGSGASVGPLRFYWR